MGAQDISDVYDTYHGRLKRFATCPAGPIDQKRRFRVIFEAEEELNAAGIVGEIIVMVVRGDMLANQNRYVVR